MSKFKYVPLTLAIAGLLSTHAHADEAKAKNQHVLPVAGFSQTDVSTMFEQTAQPMELAALSGQEMKETQGALANFAVGAVIGAGLYVATTHYNESQMTWQGFLFSAGAGALTGGVGGALIRASGADLAAQVAWRPSMLATNFGLSQFRNSRGW